MWTIAYVCTVMLAALVGIVALDPRAKDWVAETVERWARWGVAELRLRAAAQRASRTAWERVYRGAKVREMPARTRSIGEEVVSGAGRVS
jgi:hypothetical protein